MGHRINILKFDITVKVFALLIVINLNGWGQIAVQDFEASPATPTWGICAGGSFTSTANGSGDTPASQRIRGGARSWQTNNTTHTLDLCAVSVSGCSSVQIIIYISSTSVTSGNGADAADFLKVSANVNGAGFPGTPDITVLGSTNARWGYNTTGVTTTAGTPVSVSGTGGTNAGTIYSKLIINIPNGSSTVALRIIASNDDANEIWSVDDIQMTGSCCAAPSTTITPSTQTVCTGAVTSVTVADASSTSPSTPSYQWQMSANGSSGWANVANGTPTGASYSGTTTNSLAITAGTTYYYRCLVTDNNIPCTATSSTSTLVVNSTPTITTQPVNKAICAGSNTSFTVAASGSPLTYQWQENSGSGYSNITNTGVYSGATTATLVLTAPPIGMSTYSYQCVISVAACSSATTTAAVLTVNTVPSAPSTPTALANPACSTGTLSAMSSTVAGVTWYWEGTTSLGTSTINASSSTYTYASSGTYYIRALNTTGNCWSTGQQSITVTVNTPVTITSGAIDKGLCSGGNTTMDITGAAATKQWYVSTDNGVTFSPVTVTAVYTAGTTANSLSITNPPASYNGNQYYCTVSVAGCPTLTSNIGVLTVTQTPSAPPTPTALANPACAGTSLAAMTSTVAGVTWYWQGTSSSGTSTTSPTSAVYNVSVSGTYYVRGRTDGSACLSTSTGTAVTINTPPSISVNPTDKTQCSGTNTTFSVSASGTSITYQWQVNTGSGYVNVTNSAPYSGATTNILTLTGITAGMNGYQYQCIVSGASPCTPATSNFATLVITAAGAPATAASAPLVSSIGCNAFNLSWTNGSGSNRLVVLSASPVAGSPANSTSYTANPTFGSGSTIASGEYVVYKGSGSSVFINGLSASTNYYYKIFEYNGCSITYLTSGSVPNGSVTTTSCSNPAGVTAVYIDACAGTCNYEGNNELVWGTSGSYGLLVANSGPTLSYNSSSPPTSVYISTYATYPSKITTLNTAVTSCSNTVFVDPNTQGYIPPNSKFLIAHSCLCSPFAYDFSGLCGSGPIYVVFGNDAAWPCNGSGGIFGNSGSGTRYFDLDFSSWGISLDPIYNFDPGSLVGGDGAYALFNPLGGTTTTYSNTGTGCAVPLIILPIELVDFYGTQDNEKNDLVWKVASEKNVSQYIIEKSEDGINFTELTRVNSVRKESTSIIYKCIDDYPYHGITYYRLSTLENNGKKEQYQIVDIDRSSQNWKALLYQSADNLIIEFKNLVPKNSMVSLFDLSGNLLTEKIVTETQTKINTEYFADGIYFVKITNPYKTENFKLIIQK